MRHNTSHLVLMQWFLLALPLFSTKFPCVFYVHFIQSAKDSVMIDSLSRTIHRSTTEKLNFLCSNTVITCLQLYFNRCDHIGITLVAHTISTEHTCIIQCSHIVCVPYFMRDWWNDKLFTCKSCCIQSIWFQSNLTNKQSHYSICHIAQAISIILMISAKSVEDNKERPKHHDLVCDASQP